MQAAASSIEVLSFSGCPYHEPSVELAREVVRDVALESAEESAEEATESAARHGFLGLPSLRVKGEIPRRSGMG